MPRGFVDSSNCPSFERVRELFDYNQTTGIVTRKTTTSSRAKKGMIVGCKNPSDNYLVLNVDRHIHNKLFQLHRIIWLWMTGEYPKNHIAHKNRIRDDNRWENLREGKTSNKGVDRYESLTHQRLKELVEYNQFTGDLFRKPQVDGTWRTKDALFTSSCQRQYISAYLDGKSYLAHRLIWFYMTGKWPIGIVDHIDRNKRNNKWVNLREATPSQSNINKDLYKNNTTGARGITLSKKTGRYTARINLGAYDTLEEAKKVRREAELRIYGNFAVDAGLNKPRRVRLRLE